ncbi:MAG: nicotinate-nucleotide--dimethylbenzimidazole phosphoribosyltransferase [Bacillota bacterium]
MLLEEALNAISPLDEISMEKAKTKLDSLTKPLNSLGKLEEIVIRLSGIQNTSNPVISKKAVIIMCADNGVVAEGVSSCPKEVTASVTRNFLTGITGVNVLANYSNAEIFVCDIGVDSDLSEEKNIIHRKIRFGTDNIVHGPAMSREEAILAIEIGISEVEKLYAKGYTIIGTGEMGIGNTTTSSAITAVLTSSSPEDVTGHGAGLSKEAYLKKIEVITRALSTNSPYGDSIDILSKLGGFDIAGLVGCFIGSAAVGCACVVDGFISSVAALIAINICPEVKKYIFLSHYSKEPGTARLIQALEMEPMLNLGMCLGEGSGAALSFCIFDAALMAYEKMGTFDDAKIEQYTPQI